MTYSMNSDPMTAQTTFGFCANAASSCAKIAAMDAIFVASILICALVICTIIICTLIGLAILGIALVLLAGLVICGKVHSHRARGSL